jgi:hypothetical protein
MALQGNITICGVAVQDAYVMLVEHHGIKANGKLRGTFVVIANKGLRDAHKASIDALTAACKTANAKQQARNDLKLEDMVEGEEVLAHRAELAAALEPKDEKVAALEQADGAYLSAMEAVVAKMAELDGEADESARAAINAELDALRISSKEARGRAAVAKREVETLTAEVARIGRLIASARELQFKALVETAAAEFNEACAAVEAAETAAKEAAAAAVPAFAYQVEIDEDTSLPARQQLYAHEKAAKGLEDA